MDPLTHRLYGQRVPPDGAVLKKLVEIGTGQTWVEPQELGGLESAFLDSSAPSLYAVKRFRITEAVQGQLWIGLKDANLREGPSLLPALDLIGMHMQSLVIRNLLYDQLRKEHDQKNKMLRHLFVVEDEERQRIAREIHDETAQVLSALLVLFETSPMPTTPRPSASVSNGPSRW